MLREIQTNLDNRANEVPSMGLYTEVELQRYTITYDICSKQLYSEMPLPNAKAHMLALSAYNGIRSTSEQVVLSV